MSSHKCLSFLAGLLLALLGATTPSGAYCAMCQTTLANSSEAQQLSAGINGGVIFLLIAPFAIAGTFFVMAFRNRIPGIVKNLFHFAATGLAGTKSERQDHRPIILGSTVSHSGQSSIQA